MRGYDRDEMYENEDLDEYEDDEEGQEAEEVEEYEEEEEPKPTKEEQEYLALRQKMKEAVRRKMKKENGVSFGNSQEKKKLPYDNFGSFFGPSKPVIAQRVIQESKSLLENQHLAARISNATNGSKKAPASTNSQARPAAQQLRPTVNYEAQAKLKAQKLKDNRDYSFLLSGDSEQPAPRKVPLPSMSNSDARSAQAQPKSRQPMSNHSKPVANGRDERKSVLANRHMQAKAANHQGASGSKRPSMTPADSRKQLGSNSGIGPGRPMGQKGLPAKMPPKTSASSKANLSNKSTLDRKSSLVGSKKPVAGLQKAPLSKMQSSVPKKHFEQRREVREQPEKAKLNSKKSVASSKPQIKAPKQMQQRAPAQVDRPKKRPAFDEDEDDDPRALIRKMFGYDPNKYAGVDEDVSDMEADFHTIEREEKQSTRIGKEEDERELRLIEEEERRERLRKEAKRRKLSQR